MKIEKIEVDVANLGHITNCYLLYDENHEGIVIDPGYDEKKIIKEIEKNHVKVKYIVITHAHADHMGALEKVQEYTGAKVIVHSNDLEPLLNLQENYSEMLHVKKQHIDEKCVKIVKEGDVLTVGMLKFEIIHTPGHTAGSMCLLETSTNELFTGDTLFSDAYGRCDLYSGNFNEMVTSLRKLFQRFQNITIYSGHGENSNIDKVKRYIKMLLALKQIKL